jgi:hypothetical protein
MARELTLVGMRNSRRFPWHPEGYLSLTASSFAPCVWRPTELLSHPAVYGITGSAGIEFGWLHLEGCDCPRCDAWRSAPAA